LKTLHILSENMLAPEGEWKIRFRIRSDSSSSVYIVSQHLDGWWACSCPGWTRRPVRNCKHLQALNLPGGQKPEQVRIESGGSPLTASETAAVRTVERSSLPTGRPPGFGRRKLDL
jgi:hypothetical protein